MYGFLTSSDIIFRCYLASLKVIILLKYLFYFDNSLSISQIMAFIVDLDIGYWFKDSILLMILVKKSEIIICFNCCVA